MRPTPIEYLMLGACVCFAAFAAFMAFREPVAPPAPRSAFSQIQAPTTRGECRNHQYVVIYTDAYGREREADEGQFCDITE